MGDFGGLGGTGFHKGGTFHSAASNANKAFGILRKKPCVVERFPETGTDDGAFTTDIVPGISLSGFCGVL